MRKKEYIFMYGNKKSTNVQTLFDIISSVLEEYILIVILINLWKIKMHFDVLSGKYDMMYFGRHL